MKNIYNILFHFLALVIIVVPISVCASNHDTDKSSDKTLTSSTSVTKSSEAIIRSIWKYEQDQTKYSPEDGVAKKIFYLSLNSDGTYHQYVQVVPISPQDYFRVKNYAIDGKWSEKNGKLVLNEYGKENTIDYNFLYSNFENIDNQFITTKK